MRRTSASLVAGTLVAALAWASGPSSPAVALEPSPGVADLAHDINQILGDSRLDIAQAGVAVKSAASGEELYSTDAGKLLLPAFNTKLFTSAAAAEVGSASTTASLTSRAHPGAARRARCSTGDLVPARHRRPDDAGRGLRRAGRQGRQVGHQSWSAGKLVAHDTWFDYVRPLGNVLDAGTTRRLLLRGPDLRADRLPRPRTTTPAVVVVHGRAAGDEVKVPTTPETGYLKIVNKATVGTTTDVLIERQHSTNTVVITGTVADPYQEWVAVDDPTRYAASLFRKSLAKHGVRVAGPTVTGAAPSGATTLAEHQSMPLSELLVPFLKLSNNIHAEILTKAMGRKVSGKGTWAAGLKVSTDFAQGQRRTGAQHARRLRSLAP